MHKGLRNEFIVSGNIVPVDGGESGGSLFCNTIDGTHDQLRQVWRVWAIV